MARLGLAAAVVLVAVPNFPYERPVQLAADEAPESCVTLPADLLAHAGPQQQDVRLMTGDREVAYQIRVSGHATDERSRPQQILNLGERNGAVSFDVQMTEPRYNRVLLRMGRAHFSVLVQVTGVQHLGEEGVTFPPIAYSSDAQEDEAQQRLIPLPESTFRYLHFELKTLALDPVTPQDIAGVEVLTEVAPQPRYLVIAAAGPPRQRPHETIYEFAVPANLPVEQLSFASDDANAVFSRTVTVHRARSGPATSGDARAGSDLPDMTETIEFARSSHARDRPMAKSAGSIGLSADATPYPSTVTVTIHNGDDEPLGLHDVRLEMRERQLCFLRRAGISYALRYGNPSLTAPQYDLSPIEAAAANASVSALGPERALMAEGAVARLRPFTERHPALLWAALILVVGTLGVVAVRSAVKN